MSLVLIKCKFSMNEPVSWTKSYSYLQVALLVANEFWEQGDLERTVLQQQPIVKTLTQKCTIYYKLIQISLFCSLSLRKLSLKHLFLFPAYDGQKQKR